MLVPERCLTKATIYWFMAELSSGSAYDFLSLRHVNRTPKRPTLMAQLPPLKRIEWIDEHQNLENQTISNPDQ